MGCSDFLFINSFPSSSEENKFENVSPASKQKDFSHSLIASSSSYFEAYVCVLLHFFFDVSYLHFQKILTKPLHQLPMNMHYPIDCFGRFFEDILQLFQFIVIELQFSSTVSRNLVRCIKQSRTVVLIAPLAFQYFLEVPEKIFRVLSTLHVHSIRDLGIHLIFSDNWLHCHPY